MENNNGLLLRLDTLPVEVLLHILQFIPAPDLIHSLSLVSKHFHQVLSNEKTWEIRSCKKWPSHNPYPPIPIVEDSSLPPNFHRTSTLKREETFNLWTKGQPQVLKFEKHIACVDAIYLFRGGEWVASGARDRSMCLINVDKAIEQKNDDGCIIKKDGAHNGWIWDFACVNNESLASGGWDATVKLWDLNDLTETSRYKTTSPTLCLSSSPSGTSSNTLVAGTFAALVHVYDVRCKDTVKQYKHHTRSVLSIGTDPSNIIISCGEDGRIVLYDLTAGKVRSRIKLPPSKSSPKVVYPVSSSFAKSGNYPLKIFYVGDIRGNVHLISYAKEELEIVKTYEGLHEKAVQVFHSLGGVYTCSNFSEKKEGVCLVHEPSLEFSPIARISLDKVELPKVHCLNNRLALAGSDSSVRIYHN